MTWGEWHGVRALWAFSVPHDVGEGGPITVFAGGRGRSNRASDVGRAPELRMEPGLRSLKYVCVCAPASQRPLHSSVKPEESQAGQTHNDSISPKI